MATARNDITGAALRTKAATDNFRNGWDRIFGKNKKEEPKVCEACRSTGAYHCSDPMNCGGPWDDRNQK